MGTRNPWSVTGLAGWWGSTLKELVQSRKCFQVELPKMNWELQNNLPCICLLIKLCWVGARWGISVMAYVMNFCTSRILHPLLRTHYKRYSSLLWPWQMRLWGGQSWIDWEIILVFSHDHFDFIKSNMGKESGEVLSSCGSMKSMMSMTKIARVNGPTQSILWQTG